MELTIENVYRLLDSNEYSIEFLTPEKLQSFNNPPKFSLEDWTDTMKLILDTMWPGYKIKKFKNEKEPTIGGLCVLKEIHKNRIFKGVTELSFKDFYPMIISKLSLIEKPHKDIDPYGEENWEEKSFFKQELQWNTDKFPILYRFLLDNKEEFKKYNNERVNLLINRLLNFTWGAVNSKHSLFTCWNTDAVAETGRNILQSILEEFPEHVICVDYDTIFFSAFDEIRNQLENKIFEIGIQFDIDFHAYFIPFNKKDYITTEHEIKVHGCHNIISNLREQNERLQKRRDEFNKTRIEDFDKTRKTGLGKYKSPGIFVTEIDNSELYPTHTIDGLSYNPIDNPVPVSMKIAAQTIGLDLVKVKPPTSNVIDFDPSKYDTVVTRGKDGIDEVKYVKSYEKPTKTMTSTPVWGNGDENFHCRPDSDQPKKGKPGYIASKCKPTQKEMDDDLSDLFQGLFEE